jgi:hypothetical protein
MHDIIHDLVTAFIAAFVAVLNRFWNARRRVQTSVAISSSALAFVLQAQAHIHWFSGS